ncbi:uncharacterized protein [Taeniopygia guttata]|uniref:uncharacterized protein isoform X3 n=1 Tax=Taeniopygia guttata TaxID=59729 RepID=UPI003BB9A189
MPWCSPVQPHAGPSELAWTQASSLQGSSTSVQQTRHFCGLQGYKLSPECRVLTAYGSHVCFLAKTAKRSLCFIQMGSMQTTNWFPAGGTVCPSELSLRVHPARNFWHICSGRKTLYNWNLPRIFLH